MTPRRPLQPCLEPGCPKLVERGRCKQHRREHDRRRGSFRERGYTRRRWDRLRAEHLVIEPHCRECARNGERRLARVVDHVVPHRGDEALFSDPSNLQTLCPSHHTAKTALESSMTAAQLRERYAPDAVTAAAIERRRSGRRGGWFGA